MSVTEAPRETVRTEKGKSLMAVLKKEYNNPDKFEELFTRIQNAKTIEDWSYILGDYLTWGNRKISDTTAIFNMNSAHNCPNQKTQENGESETGLCQVPWEFCYAGKTEDVFDNIEEYRDCQEFLWDNLDPVTFSEAFIMVVERKIQYGNKIDSFCEIDLRLNESGDFRHNQDVYKAEKVAEILTVNGIESVYTYSASYKIDAWLNKETDYLTVMQSVSTERGGNYGDKEYNAFVLNEDDIPEDDSIVKAAPDGYVWCPHDLQKQQNTDMKSEDAISCGDCRLCLKEDGPDVAIPIS
jgi:hypothetical protein